MIHQIFVVMIGNAVVAVADTIVATVAVVVGESVRRYRRRNESVSVHSRCDGG